jgi:hypothetical protein
VIDGERRVGRIFRSNSAPTDRPWMWTITGAVVVPRLPSHGLCATLDEAKAALPRHGANGYGSEAGPRIKLDASVIARAIVSHSIIGQLLHDRVADFVVDDQTGTLAMLALNSAWARGAAQASTVRRPMPVASKATAST